MEAETAQSLRAVQETTRPAIRRVAAVQGVATDLVIRMIRRGECDPRVVRQKNGHGAGRPHAPAARVCGGFCAGFGNAGAPGSARAES